MKKIVFKSFSIWISQLFDEKPIKSREDINEYIWEVYDYCWEYLIFESKDDRWDLFRHKIPFNSILSITNL